METTSQQIVKIYPPLIGVLLKISQVPDQVFSEKMIGDGVAIEPLENKIYAPITGTVKSVHKAKHAIIFTNEYGFDILVHLGIDTVNLNGVGFDIYVKDGDKVKCGTIVGEFDFDSVSLVAKSLITPVILVDIASENISFVQSFQDITSLDKAIMNVTISDNKLVNISNLTKENLVKSKPIVVHNTNGIHARPATRLSSIARNQSGTILLEKDGNLVNAKSVVSIMNLGVEYQDTIYLYAPTEEIIEELIEVITNFVDETKDDTVLSIEADIQQIVGRVIYNKYYGFATSSEVITGTLVKKNEINFVLNEHSDNVVVEQEQFLTSIALVKKDINDSLQHVPSHNEAYGGILSTHLELLNDPQILQDTLDIIKCNKTAAYAFNEVIRQNCFIMAKSGNKLLIERQIDLKDLRNRVLSVMSGVSIKPMKLSHATILLANEITPADMMTLDKNIVGLISVTGGTTSHVAILARASGIPLLVGVSSKLLNEKDGVEVILDGVHGFLNIAPNVTELNEAKEQIVDLSQQRQLDIANVMVDGITLDGKIIKCMANITSLEESRKVISDGSDGVGLFRTEFIYFERVVAPTANEQHKIYSEIANNLTDRTFTIRTLDLGGDKLVDYIKLPHETNPALGIRGIRLCLEHRELLIEQLSAILRVEYSNIKVMLPMITYIEEYREVKQLFEQLQKQLQIKSKIDLGIMVEVPSVALLADVFAREVDFFSIGTNDLSQYILAIDREHPQLANQIDHLHPAVIKSIELVTISAAKYEKQVSVCGLMASERLSIPVLIGLGVDILSMNSNVVADNKAFIRGLNYADCIDSAKHCLTLASAQEVRDYLTNKYTKLIV